MKIILVFIFGLIVGGLIVEFKGKGNKVGLIENQAREKKRGKEAILEILKTQSPLTNNQIEQLLGVSDATATRYLEELEKEGRVRQVGQIRKNITSTSLQT